MDFKYFIEYFIENNRYNEIKNGFQHSSFNNVSLKFSEIVKVILMKYPYSYINCQQNGIPTINQRKDKKISFCTDFETLIDNLFGLYNFEFSKYILFKLNFHKILINHLKYIDENSNNYYELLKKIKDVLKLYFDNKLVLDVNLFNERIKETAFFSKYQIFSLKEIVDVLISDLENNQRNMVIFNEIKRETLRILEIIFSSTITEKIVINSIDDLIIDFGNLNFDIVYSGSFIKIAKMMYEIDSNNDQFVKKYNLQSLLSPTFIKNIIDHFGNLIIKINNLYPNVNIEIDQNVLKKISIVILDWFMYIGELMAQHYDISLSFDKPSRFNFKTILSAIISYLPKNVVLTESQLAVLHYILLSEASIEKSKIMIKKINVTAENENNPTVEVKRNKRGRPPLKLKENEN